MNTTNGPTTGQKPAVMMSSNTASPKAVQALLPDSVKAMESWIKNGTIPNEYMRQQLGDPSKGVIIPPATPVATPTDSPSGEKS